MTTLTVVKKGDTVAIAADGLTTFGDTRLARSYKGEHDKILNIAGSWIGICGSSAHHLVLLSAFSKLEDIRLGSRMEVYETFRRLHPILKEHAFLNPKEDEDDPYESSQITALIANGSGIYGIYSYREVFEFDRVWAAGSGRNFALGAMHALYDTDMSAAKIAEAGVAAGIEFDTSSGPPIVVHEVKLEGKPNE
ncbi:MAG: 20S proteasome A and B subunit [Rhodocyclaceae bacterium]|nr:MAG: 20S proteasome A and B subunit [Rhodocyclaceae bacterium]TND01171.1 MAG: 20S proteasome A and B subunit [Rhodocyclaceae bacterium]